MNDARQKQMGLQDFLDKSLSRSITTFYGPPGSGKTLFCLILAIKSKKKVVYIDTKRGFSTSRLKQLSGDNKIFENILLLKPKSFYEQSEIIKKLKESITNNIGLIIIDTISYFFRLELAKKDPIMISRVLASQLNILNEISKKNKIPVVITSEVYDDLSKKGSVKVIGGEILKRRTECLIELKKYNTIKKAVMHKPSLKEIIYKIEEKGITEIIPH